MRLKLIAFRLLAMTAMTVCTAMLLDYLLPTPAFCGFRAGCDEVTASAFGRPLGVPLPLWGLAAFTGFFVLTFLPAGPLGRFVGPAAILAGAAGLGFILLQVFVLRKVCPLCMIIDTCGLLLAAAELGLGTLPAAPGAGRRWPWIVAASLALGAAPAWTVLKPAPPVPEKVRSLAAPGYVTVVEVTDFACPYCRQTQTALRTFLADEGSSVRLVRFLLPLENHPNARPAARAYFAAAAQGKGEPMADALFAASDLSVKSCEHLAGSLGLDLHRYRQAVNSPATDAAINAQVAWLDRHVHPGLPLIWVGDQRLIGQQTPESLSRALRRARQHQERE